MPITTTYGQPLQCKGGMTAYPNYPVLGSCGKFGTPSFYTDGYQWMKVVNKPTTVKRVKPRGFALLTSQTSRNWDETINTYATEYSVAGNYFKCPYQAGATPSSDRNIAYEAALRMSVSGLLQQVKDEKWNLSTFLGELPDTLRFLGKVTSGLITSYRAVKRGDMRKLRNMTFPLRGGESYRGGVAVSAFGTPALRGRKKFYLPPRRDTVADLSSQKWLEWRYAVSPMMFDVGDACKALYDARLNLIITKAEGRSTQRVVKTMKSNVTENNYYLRYQVATGVYYRVNPDVNAFKKLGLLNPLATLYELTPLSFVYDWFFDMGTYIGNLDAMAGTTVLSTYQVLNTSEFCTMRIVPQTTVCGTQFSSEGRYQMKAYSRVPNVALTNPAPVFKLSMNASRFLDSLSLLKQFFR